MAGLAAAPLEADLSLKAGTVASAIQSAHVPLATSDKQARRKNDSLLGTRFWYNSHPITSTNGAASVWGVGSASSTLNDLTAGGGDTSWLGGTGSLLWGWLTGGSGGSARAVLLLLIRGSLVGLGDGLSILLVLVDGPIKDIVVLESLADEEITEDLAEIRVVWLVVETKGASVVQVDSELVWESTAENLGRGGHLLLHDAVVLLLLGGSLESLPWEGAAAEVEHDISERLHVITARLLCKEISIRGYA